MEEYAGRVLADRYRLPLPLPDARALEPAQTRAFDTYSGQEVLVRQVPLPEVVEAEVIDADGLPAGFVSRSGSRNRGGAVRGAGAAASNAVTGGRDRGSSGGRSRAEAEDHDPYRRHADPVVQRAMEIAQAAAQIPDHPRLDQVFDVFVDGGSLWIVSELVAARPLAALLSDGPLSPYRAAEVAADVVTALRVLHAHGWVHRNITATTVLICDDGRVMLTGLAVGAAEEGLSGYDPRPDATSVDHGGGSPTDEAPAADSGTGAATGGAAASGRPSLPAPGRADSGESGHGTGQGAPRAVSAVAAYRAGTDRAAAQLGSGQRGQRGPHDDSGPRPGGPARDRHEPGREGHAPGPYGAHEPEPYGTHAPGRYDTAPPTDPHTDPYTVGGYEDDDLGVLPPRRPQDDDPGYAGYPAEHSAHPGSGLTAFGQEAGELRGRHGLIDDPYGVHGGQGAHGPDEGPDSPDTSYRSGSPDTSYRSGSPDTPYRSDDLERPEQDLVPGWDAPPTAPPRGPATALAAERSRHARMALVGPVTERWAPEQAGPVHENWQLAAPIGPATDLWALGALLFRAVQGHAPYPEDSTSELVELVCAEPPAYAEECGPLRPVVESLLRQDPTERLDFEELRGWLRSLVRSAPEPELGGHALAAAPDPELLPIVRRRGDLVRRRRKRGRTAPSKRGRAPRKDGRGRSQEAERHAAREHAPAAERSAARPTGRGRPAKERSPRAPREPRIGNSRPPRDSEPSSLGRILLLCVLVGVFVALLVAVFVLPGSDSEKDDSRPGPQASATSSEKPEGPGPSPAPTTQGPTAPATPPPGAEAPSGFTVRKDPEGFQLALPEGAQRVPKNGRGQILYTKGGLTVLVVPGRDAAESGEAPLSYQAEREREIQPFRDSSWGTSSGIRQIDVGGRSMAEGEYTWQGANGGELLVRNRAMLIGGRFHVLQVRGPETERDEVSRLYESIVDTYRFTG